MSRMGPLHQDRQETSNLPSMGDNHGDHPPKDGNCNSDLLVSDDWRLAENVFNRKFF